MSKLFYTIIFLALLITGIALIGWGAAENDGTLKLLLTSIGGSLIGANISLLIGSLRDNDHLQVTKRILTDSLESGFSSNEEDISAYRKTFHHYHMTEIRKDQFEWRYFIIDFSNSQSIGKLTSEVSFIDPDGELQPYKVEAGARNERLIMFLKAHGREPAITEVYPLMGKEYIKQHCGLTFVESYAGRQLLSPCIITEKPIKESEEIGTVFDKDVSEELSRIWRRSFSELNTLLPLIINQSE